MRRQSGLPDDWAQRTHGVRHLHGLLGQSEDIANVALFLASPAFSCTKGKVPGVDGGIKAANF